VGFPIRKSPDQRSVGNSPKLFAATHVLHRLLAPRHPPHALSSLLNLNLLIPRPPRIGRLVETRDQGPGLCSSQQTRKNQIHSIIQSSKLFSAKIDFNFVFNCQRARSARAPPNSRFKSCGADRARTDDFQLAKLALSQLSYSPKPTEPIVHSSNRKVKRLALAKPLWPARGAVGLGGLEPPTSRLSGARSSHLSYRPKAGDAWDRTRTASKLSKNRSELVEAAEE
jgi:hypothetical protein